MLVDISSSEEEILKNIRNGKDYNRKHFQMNYLAQLSAFNRMITAAKIYVLDNHAKVRDWTQLDFTMKCKDVQRKFFGPKREISEPDSTLGKILQEMENMRTQVESVTEAFYDWSDGDFSIKINGEHYLWLHPEPVIAIAAYVEADLRKQSSKSYRLG